MSCKHTFFITGGGTGGHIYPAVAIADALESDSIIYYIGNPKNLEFDIVSQKNYDFLPIDIHGMPRKAKLDLVFWGVQLCIAVLKCIYYILKFKPDAVFGTGGYVSAPALIAAKFLKVPYVMHDCDANPGLVTRKLASSAQSVSLAFEGAKKFISNKNCYVNGNPIRAEFKTLDKTGARKLMGLENKLTLCIMGGSQGAKSINNATVEILKKLSQDYDIQIIFQTGKKKFDDVIDRLSLIYPNFTDDKNIIVKPYFDDMTKILKAADIAVSRAGSLSISELCACGIATIFVPYPHAAADHQRKNASFMAENGAGLYVEDIDLTAEKLLELLTNLINNKEQLKNLQAMSSKLAKFDGVDLITTQIKALKR